MVYVYSVFGLRLSCDLQIPGFVPQPVEPPYDVVVSLAKLPEWLSRSLPPDREALYVSGEIGESGQPSSRVWSAGGGDYFRIVYDEGTDCVVDRTGTRIWIWWPEPYTLTDMVPYLQGQLLGLVQRLRGVTCLHASAILIDGCGVAIAGFRGAGKSSTAAAFLKMGFPVLADDVVPVFEKAGKFMVQPAHPRIWLRPDMVESLFGSSDALPLLSPSWEKRYLDLNAAGPGWPLEPKPLAAIYVLSERANEPERPEVTAAAPRDTLLQLLCNTYMNHLLDPRMRAQEFATLSRLQQSLPVRMVYPHQDASRISQLCQVICADLADLRKRSPMVYATPHETSRARKAEAQLREPKRK